MQFVRICMEVSILHFKGSQIEVHSVMNICCYLVNKCIPFGNVASGSSLYAKVHKEKKVL